MEYINKNMAVVDTFSVAVAESLRNWTVLSIAKQHGCGGRNAVEKEEWLSSSIVQIFHDNDLVYPDEIADFVSEALFNEFDTIVEDGSLLELCKKLCSYYQLCKNNKVEEVQVAIETLISSSRPLPSVTVYNDEEDDNDEELQKKSEDSNSRREELQSNGISDQAMDVEEDDGWEVVRRSKKK